MAVGTLPKITPGATDAVDAILQRHDILPKNRPLTHTLFLNTTAHLFNISPVFLPALRLLFTTAPLFKQLCQNRP